MNAVRKYLADVHKICYVHDIVNITYSMNIDSISPRELERDLAKVLRELLSSVTWLHGWTVEPAKGIDRGWDLQASVPLPTGGKAVLCIECKLHFQPSQFSSLIDRPCHARHSKNISRVLAMPFVSPRMAGLCQEHEWSWFDLAGNCRLNIPGVLVIERTGNQPVRVQHRAGANLSTPESGRIVRALLAPENVGQRWTQRDMVTHFAKLSPPVTAPSLALVNKIVQHLRDQAFVEQLPNRGFRVRDYEGLLQAWSGAYRLDRHARRQYFTLLQGRSLQEKLKTLDPEGRGRLAYAAFSAADFQAAHVRQPKTWLYVERHFEDEFRSALETKAVDSGENLIVLIPEDAGVFYRLEPAPNRLACTNLVQTYVDLAHAGGRGNEAAEALLQQRLKPAWAAAA
jgi:hypothetical protein